MVVVATRPTPPSLARRVLPAIAVAGASAALVSALDHPSQFVAGAGEFTGSVDGTTQITVITAPNDGPNNGPTTSSTQVASSIPTVPDVTVASNSTTVAVDSNACVGAAIAGSVVNTRWGPEQVQAVLTADHRVCDVSVLQSPNSHNRSVRINDYATPILHDRAIAAGNAKFNAVSGATITSRGYMTSLQSILDQA